MAIVGLVLVATVTACAGAETSSSTTSVASTTTPPPTPTTTVPPTTTSTLSPEDVVNTLRGHLADPEFSGRVEIEFQSSVGAVSFTGTGVGEFSGNDSHMVIEIEGFPAEESITYLGQDYERKGDGPWVSAAAAEDPFGVADEGSASPIEALEFSSFVATLGALEHQGTIDEGGRLLHRLGLPAGTEADPTGFGFDADEVSSFEVSFLATPEGTPAEMRFEVEEVSDETAIVTTFILRFRDIGAPVEIAAPDDPWLTHTSADLGYTIAHPSSWNIEELREDDFQGDLFVGLDGEELDIYLTEIDPPETVPLNLVLEEFRSSVGEGFTFEPAEEIEVVGFPARRLTYSGEDEFGSFAAVYVVTQVDPSLMYELVLFGDDDLGALLDDFLSTFELSD